LTGDEELVVSPFDHDYMSTAWKLSPFVENVVEYISGFVVYKISKLLTCDVCLNELQEMNNEKPVFMKLKNRGTYLNPSKGVIKICKEAEKIIRQYSNKLLTPQIISVLTLKVLGLVRSIFNNDVMDAHIKSMDIFDNHKIQLLKLVIETYLKCRLHYEATKNNEKEEYIRQKYYKLVLFKHQ
jgi:hypothetical protein